MADTLHLEHRNGVYHYRRRVPDELVRVIGKKTVKQSLKTGDLKEARKARNILDVNWDAKFDEAYAVLATRDQASERDEPLKSAYDTSLDRHGLTSRLTEYIQRELARIENQLTADPFETSEEKTEALVEASMVEKVLSKPDHGLNDEWVSLAFHDLVGSAKLDGITRTEAAELIRRGLLEIAKREIALLNDDFRGLGYDNLFSQMPAKPKATFGEVARELELDEFEKAELNHRDPRWISKVRSHIRFLIEYVGTETPIADVDYDLSKRLQRDLAVMPKNRVQRYPNLSIEAAIAKGREDNIRALDATTQRPYLDFFKKTMALAVAKGLIANNPAVDLVPLVQSRVSAAQKRSPFTAEQISAIFNADFYRAWGADGGSSYKKPDRNWRFWLPLLLAYGGFRPGEACQLLTSDIRQTSKGVWYADVSTTEDEEEGQQDKSLKTVYSRRKVPIHPALMDVGFLSYVEMRRGDKKDKRLLSGLKPDKTGRLSEYPCRRFREAFLPDMVVLKAGQSVYSFRHSYRDALRRIHAPADVVSALGGWTEGKKVSDNYGDKYDPDYLSEFVDKLSYPGVSLNFNYFSKGSLVAGIKS